MGGNNAISWNPDQGLKQIHYYKMSNNIGKRSDKSAAATLPVKKVP
jgi:hypothetical protein